MVLLRQKWFSGLPILLFCLSPLSLLFVSSLPMASTFLTKVPPSPALVPGTKTGTENSDGSCEPALASPASHANAFPVLHLVEDLRLALEMLEHPQERAALLSQIPGPTAAYIKESLVSGPVACSGIHWGTQPHNCGAYGMPRCLGPLPHLCTFQPLLTSHLALVSPPLCGPSQQEGRAQASSLKLSGQPACLCTPVTFSEKGDIRAGGEQAGEFSPAG